MSSRTDRARHGIQRVIARASRRWHVRRSRERSISWVVGPVEIASMVSNLARAITDSYSVALAPHPFYDFHYDFQVRPGRGDWLRSRFGVPWEFGRLAAAARGFIYVGADGMLLDVDDRAWEFGFLKRHGVHVVCVFTGSDIRSPLLMRELQRETGLENIATYLDQVLPVIATPAYENQRRRRAEIADRFADVVFNASVDQLSYLRKPTQPFPYFYPDGEIRDDLSKHRSPGPRTIVHAPSSPIIKGTQVVRAAIQRLRAEGFEFEYRELIGTPHGQVILALQEAHIALNEFYAFVPGVFGVEAMANGCALLTRADETIETDLPSGSNSAWVVTTAADVYSNLRELLENPERIASHAAAGLDWVRQHAAARTSGARVSTILDAIPPTTDPAGTRPRDEKDLTASAEGPIE